MVRETGVHRRFAFRDWVLLGAVAALQLAIAAALRFGSLSLARRLSAPSGRAIGAGVCRDERRVVWAIEATGRRLAPLSTCLVRALAAEAILRSASRALRFAIGVRHCADGSLQAHAWVAEGSRVLIGGSREPYERLVEWNTRDQ